MPLPHALHRIVRPLRGLRGFTAALAVTLALGAALGGPVLALVNGRFRHPRPAPAPPAFDRHGGWTPDLRTADAIRADAVDALVWIALAMALLVIAGAAVNLATLLLARASARRHETAVRAVVGATPAHLAGRALAEGVKVGAIGGGAGLLLGMMMGATARRSWPADAGWLGAAFPVAGWTATVAAALTVLVLLAAAVPPALAARRDLHAALTVGARATAGPGETLLRKMLAVLQFAGSATLLTGALLLLRGGLPRADAGALGFDPRDTLAFTVRLPDVDASARAAMQQRMLAAASGIRGVRSATAATPGPWLGLAPEDRLRTLCDRCVWGNMYAPQLVGTARHHAVSPGWFRATGVRVLAGRELRPDDGRAVLINRVFAATLLPRAEPVGQQVVFRGWWDDPYTVVGVVDDARAPGPGTGGAPEPTLYLSALRHPPHTLAVAVRTTGDPADREPLIRRALAAAVPGASVGPGATMQAVLDRHRAPLRWFAVVLAVLGVGATVAAAGGLYGVMAFSVARRTREIGVRMATGATERHVLRQVLGEALRITLIGGIVGSIGAVSVARLLQQKFYGVDPFDPATYLGVAALLAAVTLGAAYRPAVRATRVHPDQALRSA
ncbi:FtsX-like permease family protein [Longimicrobium sp.]|uniref:FtsX-like permease family protein n=1 Tax=Longimicrobium sp. TaxID=2029185 RepID=UPI003B3B5D44